MGITGWLRWSNPPVSEERSYEGPGAGAEAAEGREEEMLSSS